MSGTFSIESVTPDVLQFLELVLADAGITPESPELRASMLSDLAARLQQQIILDLLDKMPEPLFDSFEKLMETNPSPERIISFLKSHLDNHAEIVAQSMMNFKDNFVTAATN